MGYDFYVKHSIYSEEPITVLYVPANSTGRNVARVIFELLGAQECFNSDSGDGTVKEYYHNNICTREEVREYPGFNTIAPTWKQEVEDFFDKLRTLTARRQCVAIQFS